MKTIIIGGNFDENGGRDSGVIGKLASALHQTGLYEDGPDVINGGNISDIERIIEILEHYDVIFWFPNIPNEYEKNRDIKSKYPTKMLITSKRNEGKYEFKELLSRSISLKANLTVEFYPTEHKIVSRVFDPTGNVWCDFTSDLDVIAKRLSERLTFIKGMTRQSTLKSNLGIKLESFDIRDSRFFDIVRISAEVFHELVDPEGKITRMLGNASFRCARGFPSFRSSEDPDLIFVSQRNVDKRYIGKDMFVPVQMIYKFGEGKSKVYYCGERKPSVDTPVQMRLYNLFSNVNYMMHSHVYIEDAPFTDKVIPCGAIEEVYEILKVVDCDTSRTNFSINLLGHGNIVLAENCDYFQTIKYVSRNLPEVHR